MKHKRIYYKILRDSSRQREAMLNLDDIKIQKDQDPLPILQEYGVTVIKSYYPENIVSLLLKEFELIKQIDKPTDWLIKLPYQGGIGRRLISKKMPKDFLSYQIFQEDRMKAISNNYLGHDTFFNYEIFLTEDSVTSDHKAQDLHFDRLPTLKFMLYLTDTNEETGAFRCLPGSHKKVQEIQTPFLKGKTVCPLELSRDTSSFNSNSVISINGKAGDLIIFDTNTLHATGLVACGARKILRAHTRLHSTLKMTWSEK